jgi:dolichol-phosphate mannosyltransferase
MIPTAGAPLLSVVIPCYNEAANVVPLAQRLDRALAGLTWEAIFVDDDSPDGTAAVVRAAAQTDSRLRCLRRVGRRGLASAVIEGAMAASGRYVAVMDGDLQHDESRLPVLLAALRDGNDIAVGSRYIEGGTAAGLADRGRERLSSLGTRMAHRFLHVQLADPMSGFFMLERGLFDALAPRLTGYGFKILLDLLLAAPHGRGVPKLRVVEVPFRFGERVAGESKLDALVMVQFGGLLLDRLMRGAVPPRFVAFAAVGLVGLGVHLWVLWLAGVAGVGFDDAQVVATVVAMVANFQLNNRLTYRTQRLRGAALWRGLVLFMLVCGLGAVANIGIAGLLYADHARWALAGAAGALIGLVWNYAVSATLVWRGR